MSKINKYKNTFKKATVIYKNYGLRELWKKFIKRIQNINLVRTPKSKNPHNIENIYLSQYNEMLETATSEKTNEYIPYKENNNSEFDKKIKLIAFYLPQFHPIPENDNWWGKGFTEWTNVTKAIPQFYGHYQPHLPGELGFYDLRVPEIQRRQVELAKNYGVYGFCFHYYWFNGKRLLEHPLEQYIHDPKIDFPFCICWANENWTRRWDGKENDVLIAQKNSSENDILFIKDLGKYFQNKNYIRINGRPVLIVYRTDKLPDPLKTSQRWKEFAKNEGWGEPYLIAAQTFGQFEDPRKIGFDAAVEFPPQRNPQFDIINKNEFVSLLNTNYCGNVFDYKDLIISFYNNSRNTTFPLFKTVSPGWDNEPRKLGKGDTYAFSSPNLYQTWLEDACRYALSKSETIEPLTFINAWNEWGEGAHLEPDRKYGYAYLEATANGLRNISNDEKNISNLQNSVIKKHDTAVILHLYYPELWEEIKDYLANLDHNYDLFVSLPVDVEFKTKIISEWHSDSYFYFFENRGRDIAPFLKILQIIIDNKYKFAFKLHTKKSPHRSDGLDWRQDILNKLSGSKKNISTIINCLQNEKTGMVGPKGHVLPSTFYWGDFRNNIYATKLSGKLAIKNKEAPFVAGSMFWFKPSVFIPLNDLRIDFAEFEPEVGEKDGTLAHALERFFGLAVQEGGYDILEIDQDGEIDKISIIELCERKYYPYAAN